MPMSTLAVALNYRTKRFPVAHLAAPDGILFVNQAILSPGTGVLHYDNTGREGERFPRFGEAPNCGL